MRVSTRDSTVYKLSIHNTNLIFPLNSIILLLKITKYQLAENLLDSPAFMLKPLDQKWSSEVLDLKARFTLDFMSLQRLILYEYSKFASTY